VAKPTPERGVPGHQRRSPRSESVRRQEPPDGFTSDTRHSRAGRAAYALRKQTVEPVFGIIKSVMGFRQFLTRGLDNVQNEWNLVCLAWNLKRMVYCACNKGKARENCVLRQKSRFLCNKMPSVAPMCAFARIKSDSLLGSRAGSACPPASRGIHLRVAQDAHLALNPKSECLAGTRATRQATWGTRMARCLYRRPLTVHQKLPRAGMSRHAAYRCGTRGRTEGRTRAKPKRINRTGSPQHQPRRHVWHESRLRRGQENRRVLRRLRLSRQFGSMGG